MKGYSDEYGSRGKGRTTYPHKKDGRVKMGNMSQTSHESKSGQASNMDTTYHKSGGSKKGY